MATRRAGTRRNAARRKATKLFNRDFAGTPRRSPSRRRTASSRGGRPPPRAGGPGGPILVNEHQRGDELALGVQQVHLGGWREHVGQQGGQSRPPLVDGPVQSVPLAAHFLFSFVGS